MSGARSKARVRAVEILFEAEQRNESVRDALV
ncbi:N utilization substance protein B, partial [Xanthomonas citri pv. citri]|nr:N utilization substance protein B [Xanthomonas citri pv. citri]